MRTAPLLAATLLLPACLDNEIGQSEHSVVGGQAESGYLAAGWLGVTQEGFDFPATAGCGAVLIGENVAITAGHCVALRDPSSVFGFGYGVVGQNPVTRASEVILPPAYNPNAPYPQRWEHDLAVLILEQPVAGVEPALIAEPAVDVGAIDPTTCDATAIYVGYGRVTVGDFDVGEGYTSERKSASQCITEVDTTAFYSTGVGGGLCWGDSGGGVLDAETGAVLGVLSDFDNSGFFCDVANEMVFTNLATHTSFICQSAPSAAPCCVTDGRCNEACAADADCSPVCVADDQCNADCDDGADPDCATEAPPEEEGGCGCRTGSGRGGAGALLVIAVALGVSRRKRWRSA